MSEHDVEYVDEHGNPIDPSELGDDYEIVDEYVDDEAGFEPDDDQVPDAPVDGRPVDGVTAPAADGHDEVIDDVVDDAPTPTPSLGDATAFAEPVDAVEAVPQAEVGGHGLNGKGKLVLAGVGVAVIAVLGGVVFGLSQIGSQNTVDDVKAAGESKYVAASSSVEAKSSEVRNEVEGTVVDACKGSLAGAMASGSSTPKLKLNVISAVPLPSGFIAATAPNADGQSGKTSLLQLTKTSWGVYVTTPLTRAERKAETVRPGFHKADVTVDDTSIRVTGDRVWAGGDQGGAGSCEPAEPGVYAASGRVPADAMGLVDGQASVTAIQGIAGEPTKAVAVMGNSVVLVNLVEAEPEGGEASSSSSAVPSK